MFSWLFKAQAPVIKYLKNVYSSLSSKDPARMIQLPIRNLHQSTNIKNIDSANKLKSHLANYWKKYPVEVGLIYSFSTTSNKGEIIKTGEEGLKRKEATNREDLPIVKNLVFQGGGSKGTVYVGALRRLEKVLGGLENIERVGGASTGVIMATLLAVGYTPEEIEKKLLREKPDLFRSFLEDGTELDVLNRKLACAFTQRSHLMKRLSSFVGLVRHPILSYRLIFEQFQKDGSLCSGENFREWLDNVIASKVAELKSKNKEEYKWLTFGELKALIDEERLQGRASKHYRELYVVGTLLKAGEKGVNSTEKVEMENYIISDAVRISMSIPLVFRPHSIYIKDKAIQDKEKQRREWEPSYQQGRDGGLLDNYPIKIFNLFGFNSPKLAS